MCGLKFKKVKPSEDCEIKIAFLKKHDNQINCPYKLNDQKGGTLAHAFYPGKNSICGDIHFDNENWTSEKHSQVMENTTYLVLLSTNWGTRWGCSTPMKKIV